MVDGLEHETVGTTRGLRVVNLPHDMGILEIDECLGQHPIVTINKYGGP